jgi:hypothetical protein
MAHNRVLNNNNGGTPTSAGAPGLLGTGMTIAGGRHDLVVENAFSGNNAWGILLVPYPGVEEAPPPQILKEFPEDNCRGGTAATVEGKSECIYEPSANEVEGNTFASNGGYGNPTNGDIGEVSGPATDGNCWHGNSEQVGGEPSSTPAAIQTTHGTCGMPNSGEPTASVLGAEAACDSGILAMCPQTNLNNYPRTEVKMLPLPNQPSIANPCEGVPPNPWCPSRP